MIYSFPGRRTLFSGRGSKLYHYSRVGASHYPVVRKSKVGVDHHPMVQQSKVGVVPNVGLSLGIPIGTCMWRIAWGYAVQR